MESGGRRGIPIPERAAALIVLLAVLSGCGSVAVNGEPTADPMEPGHTMVPQAGVLLTVLQGGLEVPWDVAFTPDGRMLVTERIGRVRVYASAEPGARQLSITPIEDVLRLGEGGGMGIAVDRDFEAHPFAYVCATRDVDGADGPEPAINELLRYRVGDEGQLTLDGPPLLTGMRANENHNGCAVETDDAGHVWLTMGDANTARNLNLSQDPNSLNGRVLRISRDGSIPDDNPVLAGADGRTAAYDLGHRNPQGIAFRDDGLIMTAEHGTDRDDELNVILPGGNYGYSCWTGYDTLGPGQEQEGPAKDICGPVEDYIPAAWASGFPTIATSGAVFLNGEHWGDWEGNLLVSVLKDTQMLRFTVNADGSEVEMAEILLDDVWGRLRALTIGPDGWLYLTTSNVTNDLVLRLELR
jgi:glucose/arabinose dehydrogenase